MFQEFATITSQILGWTSTAAWSISFYPQALLNYQRKRSARWPTLMRIGSRSSGSVQGLSFDFVFLNVEGFLAYFIYNISLFASASVRDEYQRRHHGHSPSVRGNDVAFAVHAFIISCFTLAQVFVYGRNGKQQASSAAKCFIVISTVSILAGIFLVLGHRAHWLDLLYFLSYLKLIISFIKLVPQAWMNFKRKSTVGWSIHNIILDFTGGICSLAQLFLDAHIHNDWDSLAGNPAKLILGLLAISFDVVFLFQHYVLYRNRRDPVRSDEEREAQSEERRPLLQ